MKHKFDSNVAELHGVVEAIILDNIAYGIAMNDKDKVALDEGLQWAKFTAVSLASKMRYFSSHQIGRSILKLEKKGVLRAKKANKFKQDRSKKYAIICAITKAHLSEKSTVLDSQNCKMTSRKIANSHIAEVQTDIAYTTISLTTFLLGAEKKYKNEYLKFFPSGTSEDFGRAKNLYLAARECDGINWARRGESAFFARWTQYLTTWADGNLKSSVSRQNSKSAGSVDPFAALEYAMKN